MIGEMAKETSVSIAKKVEKSIAGDLKSSMERKYMLTRAVRPNSTAPSVKNFIMNCL